MIDVSVCPCNFQLPYCARSSYVMVRAFVPSHIRDLQAPVESSYRIPAYSPVHIFIYYASAKASKMSRVDHVLNLVIPFAQSRTTSMDCLSL
jgi:hypothetical protein